jgi:hypothetical protein
MAKKLVPVLEQVLIALRPLIINQALGGPLSQGFPASLIYVLIVSQSPAIPLTFMLPSRNTSAGRPAVQANPTL